ncbi:glutamate racemase [Halothermothrix orenii]|uniref:Glutamate racemase n=1 Tax=Halothermothrix orenii (strain H 168 / OCM 544 / DSM 9562) TaxID=373903 RepID=MURI_HALOH|nr:glutamate racemase [Halothermothrix orenii]B8D151.1 RecName: Full=Glutamate racemase [Halothermothrix orenii H 168]ACL69020.1 glutamate racemase [Halothermothrix orenii H 168]
MRIGIFDSGVGGITVLKEALNLLPGEDYIYYADTANVPYGTKDKNEVRQYIFKAVEFLINRGIEALVVACNTATSIAIKDLRETYQFPIVGMEPAVKPAVERSRNKKVLVLATPLTIREEKFRNLVSRVKAEDIVDSLGLPGLVEYAEGFVFDENIIIPYLKDRLSPFNLQEYGTLVLGCTHFLYFRDIFNKIIPDHIDIIDGNKGTVRHLKNLLLQSGFKTGSEGSGEIIFYSSGKKDERRLKKYLDILKEI